MSTHPVRFSTFLSVLCVRLNAYSVCKLDIQQMHIFLTHRFNEYTDNKMWKIVRVFLFWFNFGFVNIS